MNRQQALLYSPLTLAYLGDAVIELLVREYLVKRENTQVNNLHKSAIGFVSAKAQSDAVERLMPILTEDETAVFKRGRNAKSVSSPKNADVTDYRRSTGLEALFGYLYLTEDTLRINYLFEYAFFT